MSLLKTVRPSLKCSTLSMEEIGSQVQHIVLKHRIFQSSLFHNQLSPYTGSTVFRIAVSELRRGVNNIELFLTGSEGSLLSPSLQVTKPGINM